MEDVREQQISSAREILRNKQFQSMTREDKTSIINTMLEKGLSIADIKMLLLEIRVPHSLGKEVKEEATRLALLPYNVFVHMVLVGNITGDDILTLCKSSEAINSYCNKPHEDAITGQVYDQYLFRILLNKINPKILERLKPNETPKDRYEKAIRNAKVFHALSCRL